MIVSTIAPGRKPPTDINVVIGMPHGSGVKYEIEKESGAILVDRFMPTPRSFPAAYGFIPGTLTDDGDPASALLLVPTVLVPGAVVRARPIGIMNVEDGNGREARIICMPHERLSPQRAEITDISDLSEFTRLAIEQFFERNKEVEESRSVRVTGWDGRAAAEAAILRSLAATVS